MVQKRCVGNLPYEATEQQLQELFAEYGEVASVATATDRETGRVRGFGFGFGFEEMSEQGDASKAIAALNGRDVRGRSLNVSEARPREERGGFDRRR